MRRAFPVACLAMGLLSGCVAAPDAINLATANAMGYSRLAANAGRNDPELKAAIRRVSRSAEHQNMQRILAGLPASLEGCLVIELAQLPQNGSEEIKPAILSLFVTADSAGFLSNFAFDGEGASEPIGNEWRVAVWPALEDPGSILPDSPADLLPSGVQETQPTTDSVLILSLVNREQTISIALWDNGDLLSSHERLVRYLPRGWRERLSTPSRHTAITLSSWRSAAACLD